jgi:NAD(P)-dependent dehydrogenase (short-subunit alcohol dehydrogenase family)
MAGSGHPDPADPGAKTDPSRAYADSKASDVLLAGAWGRRLTGVGSVAVDPGWVKTKLASSGAPGTVDTSADSLTYLCTEADLASGLYWRGRRTITVPKHLRDEAYQDALAATCDRLATAGANG